jgi:hypothetical protein
VLSTVTLCLRFDEKIQKYRLRVHQLENAIKIYGNLSQQLAVPPHGFVASQDYLTKAAEAAMKARELEDRGKMRKAQEAYLIAIEYLKMAKIQYANDRELVQT